MPVYDPDARPRPLSIEERVMLLTLQMVYREAQSVQDLDDFRSWLSLQIENLVDEKG